MEGAQGNGEETEYTAEREDRGEEQDRVSEEGTTSEGIQGRKTRANEEGGPGGGDQEDWTSGKEEDSYTEDFEMYSGDREEGDEEGRGAERDPDAEEGLNEGDDTKGRKEKRGGKRIAKPNATRDKVGGGWEVNKKREGAGKRKNREEKSKIESNPAMKFVLQRRGREQLDKRIKLKIKLTLELFIEVKQSGLIRGEKSR